MVAGFPDSLITFRGALLERLSALGLDVHVGTPDVPYDSIVRLRLESMGIIVHEIALNRAKTNPLADIGTIFSLIKLMLKIKPDYVLGYTIKPVIYGMMAAFITRVPHRFALITGLGYAFIEDPQQKKIWLKALVRKLYKMGLKCAQTVFFQNADDQTLFKDLNIISKTKSSVVVNGSGIDVDAFVYTAPKISDSIVFLLIARLLKDKGVCEYAEAAGIIKRKYPQAVFQLAGWIDEENPTAIQQAQLDEWINSGTIEFLGRLADVRPAVEQCTVYVLPSYREGTPRTVLEAMAIGRAVITTDAPGCRETVIDGVNGYLVALKSVDELVIAMEQCILNPEKLIQMGLASRSIAEAKYDVRSVNKVMIKAMGIKYN